VAEHGLEADFEIPVSPEQGLKFARLSTPQEKSQFVTELLKSDPKLHVHVQEALQRAINEKAAAAKTS